MTKGVIALVANTTWNIYNFRLNLIEKFIAEGWEIAVIAPVDEYLTYKEKYPMVRHYGLRMLDRDSTNPVKDMLLVAELVRKYRKIRPDLIMHFTNKPNIFGGIAAGIIGFKSVAVVTGLGFAFIHNGYMQSIITMLYRLTAGFHRKFIFENTEDRQLFIDSGIISSKKSVSVKGCGVDTSFYTPIEGYRDPEKKIFTFIGRLLYDKGIREFVEAARTVKAVRKDVEFWVVGELDAGNPATVDKDELVRWIDEKIIYYHGFVKDVRNLIGQSDCIVLPSYREGLPRIIIEGMSMAKPVITTDTPGCNETVDPGINGFLAKARDANDLAEQMNKILELSEDQRIEMGLAGRLKACREFDEKLVARDIYGIVADVISQLSDTQT